MNNVNINLHGYCSNFINLHIFSLIDDGNFEVWMCKIEQFFYFTFYDVNALIRKNDSKNLK